LNKAPKNRGLSFANDYRLSIFIAYQVLLCSCVWRDSGSRSKSARGRSCRPTWGACSWALSETHSGGSAAPGTGCTACFLRWKCLYVSIVDPAAPSGIADGSKFSLAPAYYVLNPSLTNRRVFHSRERLLFGLILIGPAVEASPDAICTFSESVGETLAANAAGTASRASKSYKWKTRSPSTTAARRCF
jgi:hypothetical protein